MFKADKNLGQHFLRDKNIINKICSDHSDEYDIIIEVGPGPGALTENLSTINKPLFLIEKDERFIEHLSSLTPCENIFNEDALKFNWEDFIKKNQLESKKIWLVSNLPYNVGTVLFTQFLQVPQIKMMTLMFQKEVGDKTYFRDIKNEMCGLLFLSLNYFESKQLVRVPPGAFSPPPKVNSNVVTYKRNESPDIAIQRYSQLNNFTRELFSQKRKQLGSVLKKYKVLQTQSRIELKRRAETLSYDEVLYLFNFLDKNDAWE